MLTTINRYEILRTIKGIELAGKKMARAGLYTT